MFPLHSKWELRVSEKSIFTASFGRCRLQGVYSYLNDYRTLYLKSGNCRYFIMVSLSF